MDFWTHNEPMELPGHWYRVAIEHVLRAEVKDVVTHSGWPAKPMRGQPDPANRYPMGLHLNQIPVICIGLQGRPILDVGQHRYSVAPPKMGILTPQVWHSEGFGQRHQAYRMLWLLVSQESALATVIHYQPGSGWECIDRQAVKGPMVTQLYDSLDDREHFPASDQWNSLRGKLLAILGQLAWLTTHLSSATSGQTIACKRHQAVLEHLKDQLDHHLDHEHDLVQLAQKTRLTPRYIARMFKAWTGESVHRYQTQQRMNHAMLLCRETNLLIKEIARRVGYDDPLYFSRAFHLHHGSSPNDVRATP